MAKGGVAGIVLLGSNPPNDLKQRLQSVQRVAPVGANPIIASDEEGGTVQRLAPLIYRLPSAETMGTWSASKLRGTSRAYGKRMADLGVRMSLAPIADLRVSGSYMDQLNRAFSSNPTDVGDDVISWSRGLSDAGVAATVKHWPGHGHAADTHQFAAQVPSLAHLTRADLVPFNMALNAGVPAVMVAHVQSKGLTGAGVPATQSPKAIKFLRSQVDPETVVVTDSLSMAAAASARGLSEPKAVIESLKAGVDWAMSCTYSPIQIVKAVAKAIKNGTLDRETLEASAARIAALKAKF